MPRSTYPGNTSYHIEGTPDGRHDPQLLLHDEESRSKALTARHRPSLKVAPREHW